MNQGLLFTLLGSLAFTSVAENISAEQQQIKSRKHQLQVTTDKAMRLNCKFFGDVEVNTSGNGLINLPNHASSQAVIDAIQAENVKFYRAIPWSKKRINKLEAQAELKSKKRHKLQGTQNRGFGLANLYKVLASDADNYQLKALGDRIESLDTVEYCDLVAPYPQPTDIAPTPLAAIPQSAQLQSANYESWQTYRGPNPGLDIDYAWSRGIKGAGIRVMDLEFSWGLNHEDFYGMNIYKRDGLTMTSNYASHGTSVASIIMSNNNGSGMTGMMYEIDAFIAYPEELDRIAATALAVEDAQAGDVILYEMQADGPAGHGYTPAEYEQAIWDLTRVATDKGAIVVATGGNGGNNMDDAIFAEWRSRGHSGAIFVGAGTSDIYHSPLGFSNKGSRFDLQGWGHNVAAASGTYNTYTQSFSGTSSAGPIVTSAVVALLSHAKNEYGVILTAQQVRDYLVDTGWDQSSGLNIGKFPNVKAALLALDADLGDTTNPSLGILTPEDGSTLAGAEQTFTWNPGHAEGFWFYAGSSQGAQDYYRNDNMITGTSHTVTGLPTDGSTVHITFHYLENGSWNQLYYTYTAANPGALRAEITSPIEGSELSGASQTFTWNAANAEGFWFYAGSALGEKDYYRNDNMITGTSHTVTGLPTDGSPVYIRFWTYENGIWSSIDYRYNAVDTGGCQTAPAIPSGLGGSSAVITWSAVDGASNYDVQYWTGVWTDLGSSATNSYNANLSGTQYVRVRATNSCGVSNYTNWVTVY